MFMHRVYIHSIDDHSDFDSTMRYACVETSDHVQLNFDMTNDIRNVGCTQAIRIVK